MELGTSIDVAASLDRVWEVLVDIERWPVDGLGDERPVPS
jgi:hypothetical protein